MNRHSTLYSLFFFFFFISISASAQSVISDSLFAQGVSSYQNEEYDKAINFFSKCDSLDMNDSTLDDTRKSYSRMWLASSYYKKGEEDIAKIMSPDYYCFPPIDRRKTVVSDSLSSVATSLFEEERYGEALEVLKTCAKIEKDLLGEYTTWYKNTITECGYLCFNMDNYEDAIKYGEIAKDIAFQVYGVNSDEHIESLSNLINYYGEEQDYDNVRRLLLELEKIKESISYESNEEHANALVEISEYYEVLEDFQEAVRLITKANDIAGQNSETRGVRDFSLFENLVKSNNYDDAILVGTETLKIWKSSISETDSTYAIIGIILTRLASCYDKTNNYLKAIELCNEAIEVYNYSGNNDINKASTLYLLSSSYNELGLYENAIKCEKEAVEIIKNLEGELSSKYAIELSNLAYYYSQIGNHVDAFSLCEEAYNIVISSAEGFDDSDKLLILSNLASHYANLGNYSRAVELNRQILGIRSQTTGKNNFEYATSLNNLATYLSHTDDYDIEEVISIQKECVQLLERLYGKVNPRYIEAISNLAVLYNEKEGAQMSISLLKEALSLTDSLYDNSHPSKVILLYNIAKAYNEINDFENALDYLKKAYTLMYSCGVDKNPEFIRIKNGLFNSYIKHNNIEEAIKWMVETYNSTREQIVENFPRLTAREREYYWGVYSEWFYSDLPQILLSDSSDVCIETLYNSALLSKGILLGTNIEVDKLIGEEDPALLTKLYKIRQYQMILDSPESIDLNIDTDSIRYALEYAERMLLDSSQVYTRLQHYYSTTYNDIAKALCKGEIAIEFITLPTDSYEKYYALCLKNGYKSPHLIYLFDSNQIHSVIHNNSLITDSITSLVWKPLRSELQDIENIYFSPIGELYRIPIESAPLLNEEGIMTDKYSLSRLSSTRELVISIFDDDSKDISTIALYGGIAYNTDSSESKNENYKNVPDLPGTKDEVESIIKMLPDKLKSYILVGADGTEESLKAFSGSKLNILHCATHAYYLSKDNIQRTSTEPILLCQKASFEDKALTHSGLYFSEINKKIGNHKSEDGALSAYEISKLDFREMKLSVLSACKTGLGDISGDGIFGLQRGFKKAGAKTIIMSLWKVDDLATQLLMTEFYNNYFKGTNMHESLRLAQKKVREYKDEEGHHLFDAPYYWAGFIMLD